MFGRVSIPGKVAATRPFVHDPHLDSGFCSTRHATQRAAYENNGLRSGILRREVAKCQILTRQIPKRRSARLLGLKLRASRFSQEAQVFHDLLEQNDNQNPERHLSSFPRLAISQKIGPTHAPASLAYHFPRVYPPLPLLIAIVPFTGENVARSLCVKESPATPPFA